MARPDHGAASARPARDRRHFPMLPVTVVVLGIAVVAMVVGTLLSNVWLLITASIVLMCVGIGAVVLYMNEP